ncbi:hypothetical protein [Niabella drilacis]|uniref:Uncharacterized protein n=1 Tax=Niabella drilacis (strain DSM 25811 / CCM 8410 / CCUG 62505 / LMG 26954 / E90) TaxID=1285928 RepID=A0A1G6YNS3_NIADE|nr:hypothetical protein [Niabella drilacis]SDD91663.1 hypothetical protein SAMN04487894_11632 [Niabella drilacis]
MASTQLIKDTLKQERSYKAILLMLVALWMVSLTLIAVLLVNWRRQAHSGPGANAHRTPSLDQMLLSFSELKIGNNTTLINLQLKEISQKKVSMDTTAEEVIADYRKKIFDRMLEQKIKTSTPAKQDGFTIKPVPQ